MSSDLPLVQAEHTALTADALLEQAVQLLIAARKGGWKISSVIQGDFQKRDHIRLDMWREPPPAESGGPDRPERSEGSDTRPGTKKDEFRQTHGDGQ